MRIPLLAFVLACLPLASAPAQTQILLLNPVADASMFRNINSPTDHLTSGVADSFFVGRTLSRGHTSQRALIRFDLTSVPCGATIRSASLNLYLFASGAGVSAPTIELHRLTASWAEGLSGSSGGAGASSQDGDVDWFDRVHPNLLWTTPGGDFDPAVSSSRTVPRVNVAYAWNSTPRMVADVAGWVANPSTNFGWILTGNETTAGSTRKFWSREATDAPLRPFLRVEYDPAVTPSVTVQPTNAATCPAGSAAFSITAVGGGPLVYRWQIEGAASSSWSDLSDGPIAGSTGFASGAGTATLNIANADAGAAKRFRCRVNGPCGSAVSNPAALAICVAITDDGSGTGTCDGGVTIDDLLYYLNTFGEGLIRTDVDDGSGTGTPDGGVTIEDLLYYLVRFDAGC